MSIIQASYLESIDPKKSLLRLQNDARTDLIYAPHLSAVYAHLGEELFDTLIADIKTDRFIPALPITLETPKKNGLTRPGSILDPFTRLTYQLLVDTIVSFGEEQVDRTRVFSQQLLSPDPNGEMFRPSNDCYSEFNHAIDLNCAKYEYVLRTDISCYFERIYHHNLINFLISSGAPEIPVRALEKLLAVFTEKDSHGIIQGLAPSDFLGNVYLCPLDAELVVNDIPSARYVDDIYLFFDSSDSAKKTLVDLCKHLRREGLNLNESKTVIQKTSEHIHVDAAVLEAFQRARAELAQPGFESIDTHYGFVSEWNLPERSPEIDLELDLRAIKQLYAQREENESYADSIEKFCIPIFSAVGDACAVNDCIANILNKPYLAGICCNYLAGFAASNNCIAEMLVSLLAGDKLIYQSQRMWILAALILSVSNESAVQECQKILRSYHVEPVRALACIYIGAQGSAAQRRILKQHYANEQSPFVRSAVLYASKYFPKNERDTCVTSWGAHSTTNSLIAKTVKKLATS